MIGSENLHLHLHFNQSNEEQSITNPNLVIRAFLLFKPVAGFYIEFSLVNNYMLIFVLIDVVIIMVWVFQHSN